MSKLTLKQYLQNYQIKCTDAHTQNPRLAEAEPEDTVASVIQAPWDETISAHLRCIWAMQKSDFEEAYRCQIIIVKSVSRLLSDAKENWLLPVAFTVSVDIRKMAHGLDAPTSDSTNKASDEMKNKFGNRMEYIAQLIMRLFQICAADGKGDLTTSKKCGMMGLANQLFKIYFQINKLNLCKSLIRAIENMGMDEHFSIAQRVTYRYYVGRKAMFDGNFPEADKCLTFALKHCLAKNVHNKRLILIYLIPVRMLLGKMPHPALLRKYNLSEFAGIVEATKSGNLRRLSEELNKHEAFFISCGIYLILEKLKLITYRNLFKRVAAILGTHQLPIEAFTHALKLMGLDDIDNDETTCILANLIHEGKIKGYIAYPQQKLVVSKLQAFPLL